ncbi:haloacid dehalogenase type II [Marivivens aquimaris]|uniref:haloacid dehalogenase type II n=1 Tax=Marivivens aquimaris TaxID=2774876 RepID=UPI00187EE4D9|nr:haloacid dehalogenase type II [Marivivens aquimaris]
MGGIRLINTCIFDAYGTLFDVSAAAREAAAEPGNEALAEIWPQLAADWRFKQLQYSWLRAVARKHEDFWQLTKDALDWALEAAKLDDPRLRERLLNLYWELSPYPEVVEVLTYLKERGVQTGILSNGTPEMLNGAVKRAGVGHLLDAVMSVETVKVFKPHDLVYEMVESRFICERNEVLFVSSNGWDAAGASNFGYQTLWVNRQNEPVDRLYAQPQQIAPDLRAVLDLV